MYTLSIIILSYTMDNDIYKMNCDCIDSLYNSENWNSIESNVEVLLIESNKNNQYKYDERVRLLIPDEPFNFNRFLNIGIQNTNSQYIALCNNDIYFNKSWFTEILKVKIIRPDILCFSTIDRKYNTMTFEIFPESKDYYIGWDNKYHFAAWCFVLDRKIFRFIGSLDETFSFYGADDDFLMTLRKNALINALVVKSRVEHFSQVVSKKIDSIKSPEITDKENYPIPFKFLKRGYHWLWEDYRYYDSFLKMYNKWGDFKMINRIDKLIDKFPFLRQRFITKIFYNKYINKLLSMLTGI